jgi:hypothetical protein
MEGVDKRAILLRMCVRRAQVVNARWWDLGLVIHLSTLRGHIKHGGTRQRLSRRWDE